jgi:hypothetical protein
MKTSTYLIIIFLWIFLFITGCGGTGNKKTDNVSVDSTFVKGLVEKQIGKSDYYISIPKEYSMNETEGPDFSTYYFSPTDTTIKANFLGGFYFGNHPGKFDPDNDSCKIEKFKSKILNDNADWTIYNCNGEFSIQTIIDSKSGEEWNELIHAFGSAKSSAELSKVLEVFRTMKKKKTPAFKKHSKITGTITRKRF